MPRNLTGFLKDAFDRNVVSSEVSDYERSLRGKKPESLSRRTTDDGSLAKKYYQLVTDFFEWGWGESFHFATRAPHESFAASLARHEHYLALKLGLRPGMRVADLGCGIGGPLREIARFSGATVVGVNINGYQLERARKLTDEAGLGHLAEFLEADITKMDVPDDSFDAAFAIESTPHIADKVGVYGEIFRVLKPGACFAGYESCLTHRFDSENARHRKIKNNIQIGGSVPEIPYPNQVDDALRQVGFEFLEGRDLAENPGPGIPWYQPLAGSGFSLAGFRRSQVGRMMTRGTLRALEGLRIVPKGTLHVARLLDLCATAIVESGQLRIFTPMYFMLARKPE